MRGMSNGGPIDQSAIIFPSASGSISSTLTTLTRSNLSISNRLASIASDAAYIQSVSDRLNLPLIANERCGSWYIPVSEKAGCAYFKSTDGHHGQWSFSLRRLNLQVLDVVQQGSREGCIIVDSTRRGKSMPDALSKTVPVWICVLNRLLFPDAEIAGRLRTPDDVVGTSEHAQIEERIPAFVEAVRSLNLDLDGLTSKLSGRPMQPVWVTPDSRLPLHTPEDSTYNLVVLCTASSRSSSSDYLGTAYVQGAADDAESWALGLSPTMFWLHRQKLLSSSADELPDTIRALVAEIRAQSEVRSPVLIKPTSTVFIGDTTVAAALHSDFDVVVNCCEKPVERIASQRKDRYVHLSCTSGKVGSRQLRSQLPMLHSLGSLLNSTSKVLLTCQSGKDLAVGAALALICLFCTDQGAIDLIGTRPALNKTTIKHRLSWIMVSMPDAAPSRATLQSVNAFLLG